MKLENFEQAKNIVEQIRKHKTLSAALEGKRVTIIINQDELRQKLMTIGANKSYEHDYSILAEKFKNDIREDLLKRIEVLESMLEKL